MEPRGQYVLKECETNDEKPIISLVLIDDGRSFQLEGPSTATARCWAKSVQVL